MNRTTRALVVALIFAAGTYLLAGCSKDSTTAPANDDTATAPQLPPASTMQMQLDFFGVETPNVDAGALAKTTPLAYLGATATEGDHANFINGFVRALWVQLLIYDALDEPIGAFALAIHSVPQHQEDGSWLWTYIFVDGDVEYSIFLTGTPMTDRVAWRMEVSSNDTETPLDHFLWFEGESMKGENDGYWQFYDLDGSRLIRIDYENSPAEHRLTLANNNPGNADEGDTVEFYASPTTGSITFDDASEMFTSEIVWHSDGSGSLTVPDYNGGMPACWDTQQVNTVCP